MKKLLVSMWIALAITSQAQVNIIPKPVSVEVGKGNFVLSKSTVIVVSDEGERNTADFFNDYLKRFYGFSLSIAKSATANYIRFETLKFIQPGQEGKYRMLISPATIGISGDTYQGTFYGMQTLIQLLPVPNPKTQKLTLPTVTIEDYPRFSYRGLHLDVGRHFMPVEFVKKYIDYIALHKMNYFHWHLTEDQGWRIEIKKYPRLTEVGAYRNGTVIGRYPGKGNTNTRYGGYYTQEEIKDVVEYASKRFITIVPEIEMPGHGVAAIAAFPWLSCFPNEKTTVPSNMGSDISKTGNGKVVQESWGVYDDVFCAGKDSTFNFLQDVIDEVLPLFPGPYIHIGGDECPKNNWKRCPNCQKRMKDNNLKDEHELQSYFIQRMEKYINGKGKTIIGWDEILEGGLAPNAIVMSWRGEQGGIEAAKQNHKVIMTPGNYVYLDHSQSKTEDSVTIGGFTPVEETYSYEPVPKELPADKTKYILGAQGNVWTEYMSNPRKVEYMIFPRLSALSEVLWTPREKKNFKDFEKRLSTQFKRYTLWNANYSKAYYNIVAAISPAANGQGLIWTLDSKSNTPMKVSDHGADDKVVAPLEEKYYIKTQNDPRIAKANIALKNPDYSTRRIVYIPIQGSTRKYSSNNGTDYIDQVFLFSKSTGKKAVLSKEPLSNYAGNGGTFGLVNGAISLKGITSPEWLGWRGDDMEAVVDLGKSQSISNVGVHVLSSGGSRIHPPAAFEVSTSSDGKNFTAVGNTMDLNTDGTGSSGWMKVSFPSSSARYIKVVAKNYSKIPEGKSGAGDPALMLIDEIVVD